MKARLPRRRNLLLSFQRIAASLVFILSVSFCAACEPQSDREVAAQSEPVVGSNGLSAAAWLAASSKRTTSARMVRPIQVRTVEASVPSKSDPPTSDDRIKYVVSVQSQGVLVEEYWESYMGWRLYPPCTNQDGACGLTDRAWKSFAGALREMLHWRSGNSLYFRCDAPITVTRCFAIMDDYLSRSVDGGVQALVWPVVVAEGSTYEIAVDGVDPPG